MTGREFAVALADGNVGVIELAADTITLQQSDWADTIATGSPLDLNRNITVRPASSLGGRQSVLDFGNLQSMVRLTPSHHFYLLDVFMVNFRQNFFRLAPGVDFFAISPLPHATAEETRPILHITRGGQVFRLCMGASFAKAANQAMRRPPELGGTQASLPLQQSDTCSHNASAPLLERCWALVSLTQDLGFEAQTLDAVGTSVPTNLIIHVLNSTSLCPAMVANECLETHTPVDCWLLSVQSPAGSDATAAANGTGCKSWQSQGSDCSQGGGAGTTPSLPQLPGAPAGNRNASTDGLHGVGEGLQSSNGSSGTDDKQMLLPALPAALGGAALAVLVAGITLVAWRRYARRRGMPSHRPTTKESPHTRAELGPSQVMTEPFSPGGVDGAAPAEEVASAATAETLPVSHVRSSLGPALHAVVQLVTEHTPQQPHVRLDLRWGIDIKVDQDALRGAGAFGRVCEGSYNGSRVAVKIINLPAQAKSREVALSCFQYECEVLSRCSHPNIVSVLGVCLQLPHPCLVMELMDHSLEELMNHHTNVLLLEQVLSIALDVASGLAYLHPTITHRDLKPANVLLDATGTAKLSDFGLARLHDSVRETNNPEAGTVPYMAPECFDVTNNIITHKADIYSWAVLVWELVACKAPWWTLPPLVVAFAVTFEHKRLPLGTLPPERCPGKLRELLVECWDTDPQRRPSAAELVKRVALLQQQLARAGAAGALMPAGAVGPCPHPHLLDEHSSLLHGALHHAQHPRAAAAITCDGHDGGRAIMPGGSGLSLASYDIVLVEGPGLGEVHGQPPGP